MVQWCLRGVIGAIALVWFVPDLVWLTIAAQVLNVFLMPLVIGLLVALAVRALPEPFRLRGSYMWLIMGICAAWNALIAAPDTIGQSHLAPGQRMTV
jgi:hypothetical protein